MPRSGIYVIANTITCVCYVGSSSNIKRRWLEHLNALRNNKHHSAYLQRSFNQHGEIAFEWSVLEDVAPDKQALFERETYWIQELQPQYNASTVSASRLGAKLTPEQLEQHRQRMQDPALRQKLSEIFKGREVSDETRARIKEARANQEMTQGMLDTLEQGRQKRLQSDDPRLKRPRLGMKNSKEQNQKIAEAHLGMKATEETKVKLRQSHLGKKQSFETIHKKREATKGHKRSEEQRLQMAERSKEAWAKKTAEEKHAITQKRPPVSEETRQKQREAKLGRKQSPEFIQKNALARTGLKRSEETRARMRESQQKLAQHIEQQSLFD